jgi:hypothetical protein
MKPIPDDVESLKELYTSWDGFDDAIIGVAERCSQEPVLVYDYAAMVALMSKRDGLSRANAEEYIQFNLVGAWIGEQTPLVFYE